ncbi:carbohydrate ABC transporter permease [Vagococcus jeotgali]|uniref:carbohydrate ABC transporter permease n=1 Tax=Vagococcus jeotgali TaxID=3109030 RepID=UPI002DDAF75F|nr:sugar ABC transporter permease [Vagococcus sp. B2T-5]
MTNISLGNKEKRVTLFLFLFIPLTFLTIFGLLPIIHLIYLSFTSWNGIGWDYNYVGFKNYYTILSDPIYLQSLRVNFYYLVAGLLQMVIAYYFAVILSEKTIGMSFFKTLFIIPTLISSVAVAMMFRLFLSPDGPFDSFLTIIQLGRFKRFWLGDPDQVNITLSSISLWRHLGISFLLYYGAIQSIPKQYYEYCQLEGASLWQKTRDVTIPLTQKIIHLNTLLLIIGVVSVFDIPFIMTNGSNGTSTIVVKATKLAFDQKKYGIASSLSVLVTLLILLLSAFQQIIRKKGVSK